MSGSLTPTVASAPTTVDVASNILSLMASLGGIPTDYNQGSQVRTLAESVGAITETQGVAGQALATQALAYGAMSLFGILPSQATLATGTVTFATSIPVSGAPNAPQSIPIPSGTLVQTAGGVQFATVANTVLASGTSSISVGILAVNVGGANTGIAGNVPAGAITGTPLTPVGYPLYVTNAAPTGGGLNPGSQSNALALFTAKAASLGLCSPVAIANGAIGVVATGTGETVLFSSVYEPWIAAGSGAGSGTAGFTLFVDNGTGNASAALLAAVQAWITGSTVTNQSGYRPTGMPFTVSGVTPVYASAMVSGSLIPGVLDAGSVVSAVTSGMTDYFSGIGIAPAAIYQPSLSAVAADAGLGAFQSLTVNLYYSGSSTPVALVSGGVGTRIILAGLSVTIGTGS